MFFLELVIMTALGNSLILGKKPVDPEVYMNATIQITSKGFPCENHYVTTKDGFILNLQRIPHGRVERNATTAQPVVLLQHGLLGSSSNFLDNLVNESLAYQLADFGADVWLGNVRGNKYSRAHVTLQPSDRTFWDWSFDEMAKYDLPAMIDYIVHTTGQTQIYYVGHSQGSTIGIAGFSQNKTLGENIKMFIALAPLTKLGHIKGPLRELSRIAKDIERKLDEHGTGEFMPSSNLTKEFAKGFCRDIDIICENVLFLLGGHDYKEINRSRIPVYVAHNPAGTSIRNMMHYAQCVNNDSFKMYDFGSATNNTLHYGQPTPPEYHPGDMEVPVMVYYGGKDYLADPDDVAWLLPQLRTATGEFLMPKWEHLDFIWAEEPDPCYNDIVFEVIVH